MKVFILDYHLGFCVSSYGLALWYFLGVPVICRIFFFVFVFGCVKSSIFSVICNCELDNL